MRKRTWIAGGAGVLAAAVLTLTGTFQKETLPDEAALRDRVATTDGTAYIDTLGPNTFWSFNVAGYFDERIEQLVSDSKRILLSEGFQKCADFMPFSDAPIGYLQEGEGPQLSVVLHENNGDNAIRAIYGQDCDFIPKN